MNDNNFTAHTSKWVKINIIILIKKIINSKIRILTKAKFKNFNYILFNM